MYRYVTLEGNLTVNIMSDTSVTRTTITTTITQNRKFPSTSWVLSHYWRIEPFVLEHDISPLSPTKPTIAFRPTNFTVKNRRRRLAWGPWNLDRNLSCRTLFTWYWSHSWRSYQYLGDGFSLLFFLCVKKVSETNYIIEVVFLCDKRLVLFRKEKCQVLWIQEFLFWNLQSSGNCMDSWKDGNASGNVHKIFLVVFPWAKSFPNCWFPKLICHVPVVFDRKQLNWMVQLHANNDGNQWICICYNRIVVRATATRLTCLEYIYIWLYDA